MSVSERGVGSYWQNKANGQSEISGEFQTLIFSDALGNQNASTTKTENEAHANKLLLSGDYFRLHFVSHCSQLFWSPSYNTPHLPTDWD